MIFQQIIAGLEQLHYQGFVHRDLKPENIVLNLDPLEVRLIDFNTAYPTSQKTVAQTRGTPGYSPQTKYWLDGSTCWDLYALGALVLEADMVTDYFIAI